MWNAENGRKNETKESQPWCPESRAKIGANFSNLQASFPAPIGLVESTKELVTLGMGQDNFGCSFQIFPEAGPHATTLPDDKMVVEGFVYASAIMDGRWREQANLRYSHLGGSHFLCRRFSVNMIALSFFVANRARSRAIRR